MGEIKVTDRRMFTPDGRLREEFERELERNEADRDPAPPESSPPPPPEPPAATRPAENAGPGGLDGADGRVRAPEGLPLTGSTAQKPPLGLLELVQFLGELSLACLGDVPQPDGRLLRDLDGARVYIDLVASLLERFGPSLAPQDRRALESFLDQIRLRYVSRSG